MSTALLGWVRTRKRPRSSVFSRIANVGRRRRSNAGRRAPVHATMFRATSGRAAADGDRRRGRTVPAAVPGRANDSAATTGSERVRCPPVRGRCIATSVRIGDDTAFAFPDRERCYRAVIRTPVVMHRSRTPWHGQAVRSSPRARHSTRQCSALPTGAPRRPPVVYVTRYVTAPRFDNVSAVREILRHVRLLRAPSSTSNYGPRFLN